MMRFELENEFVRETFEYLGDGVVLTTYHVLGSENQNMKPHYFDNKQAAALFIVSNTYALIKLGYKVV